MEQEPSVDRTSGGSGMTAIWEIVSVTSSFLIAGWVILPLAGNSRLAAVLPLGLAFALMFFSHRVHGETMREIGWRLDNFWKAGRLLLLPMLAAAFVIVGLGLMMRSLRFNRGQIFQWALWLVIWGLLQQYVLQGFINRRAQIAFGRGWKSILVVALIFAILHLPNPWLAGATFVGGIIWAYVYQRVPNLFALALSHSVASLLLACSLSSATLNSLRVGIRYFG